ncbi:hypothetical protein [Streptomyces sp. RPT161]|uniref:hypothetical protein n=1 Tax=Streptomyces sp. RPT161 TaxID=3015993 RepID=UPI0022B8C319|nr:hypothetical protein [Streptomyces sp. RPT161]
MAAIRTQPRSARPRASRVPTRLPWWAVALPAIAFAGLLALVADPAHAAAPVPAQPLDELLGRLTELLPRLLSHLL